MPAFFSKVFARGKEKEKEKGKDGLKEPSSPTAKQAKRFSRSSAQSLLEGKFEAVSPSVSPTAEKYEEKDQTPKKDKEKGAGLFRPKSRTMSGSDATRKQEDVPQLKLDLNLPSIVDGPKKRNLSIVYEGDAVLDEAVLGEKKLSPTDALKLMRACLTVLTSRGLETLGIMHPHWHSASPAAQRKIVSLFISSLAASSESSAAASSFDSELEYARSPHDVAAVFRWALRHLKLEGNSFDNDNTPSLAWYDNFMEKEKAADHPKTAYSDLLLPAVKPSHAELLGSTLSLVSRLASHSEWNGTSGSKLSMFFGHYLLTGNRVENLEDWLQFYSQWERAGRALEHIFLASLRDEEAKTGIPRRLSELVVNYPYAKPVADKHFPRPTRFATRSYDALYVRVTAESQPRKRSREETYLPLHVVENALTSVIAEVSEDKDLVAIWNDVRKLSSTPEGGAADSKTLEKSLGNIFADESIRMLSLKTDSLDKGTPTINMFTPVPEHDSLFGTPTTNGRAKTTNGSTSVSRQTSEATTSSPIAADWNVFSSAGFGESAAGQSLAATLLDNDLEKTDPPKLAPRRSLKKSRSPGRASRADKAAEQSSPSDGPLRFKTSRVSLVKLDEAFVDFWSDALLDPISDSWPNFVVCQLKSDAARTRGDKKISWIVIEQKVVAPSLPPPPSPARRASSPRPSVRSDGERSGRTGRASATFSPRKRFNFFSSQSSTPSTVSGAEKRESKWIPKGAMVNELGEIIPEEKVAPSAKLEEAKVPESKGPPIPEKPRGEAPKEDSTKLDDVAAGAAAVAVGAGAVAVAAEAAAGAFAPELPPKDEETKQLPEEVAPEVPAKKDEAEPEPELATAPVEDEVAAEEPEAAPAAEQESTMEVAPPQPETSAGEVAKAEEPSPPEPEPEAEPVTTAVVEEAAPPPETETPVVAAEPSTEETEGTITSSVHVAGDSRFVEHIENTPPDNSPTVLEPIAGQDAAKPDAEPVAVPEAIPEEVSQPPAEPAEVPEGKAGVAGATKAAAKPDDGTPTPILEETEAPEPEAAEEPKKAAAPEEQATPAETTGPTKGEPTKTEAAGPLEEKPASEAAAP